MSAPPGEATTLTTAFGLLRPLFIAVLALALPLLLVSTNVRLLFEDRDLFVDLWTKYDVGATTGLSHEQLQRVADAFVRYFRGPEGRLDVEVVVNGQTRLLFNEREIAHMQDVQKLIHAFQRLQIITALAIAIAAAVGLTLWRQAFLPSAGWALMVGAALTLALIGVFALLAVTDFQSLFVRFHLLSFQNDLWMLDPERDYLIMLNPLGVWMEGAMRLALMTAAEAALSGACGFVLLRLGSPSGSA